MNSVAISIKLKKHENDFKYKTKASRGGLANRQLPSGNNSNTSSSASNVTTAVTIAAANSTNNISKRTLSNSSSDCALEDSEDDAAALQTTTAFAVGIMGNNITNNSNTNHHLHAHTTTSASNHELNMSNGIHHNQSNIISNGHHHNNSISGNGSGIIGGGVSVSGSGGGTVIAGTTTAILLNSTTSSVTSVNTREQQINQLYAQVHKDHKTSASHTGLPGLFKSTLGSPGDVITATPNDFHRGGMTTFGTSSRDLNSSYDSILGSNDKLSENEQSSENWMYPSRRRVGPTGAIIAGKLPPASFTEQLNQALSERER